MSRPTRTRSPIANAGIGAASHLCGMLFMSAIETPLTTVPYKGTGPAHDRPARRPGRHHVRPDHQHDQADQGRRDQGLCRDHRRARSTCCPTCRPPRKRACRAVEVGVWHGLYAPKGTPRRSSTGLSQSLQKALKDENVAAPLRRARHRARARRTRRHAGGAEAKLEGEIARWKPVIEAAGQYAD